VSPSINARYRYRWRDYPLIPASVALHAVAAGVVGWHPSLWPWAASLVISNHAALTGVGLWPQSTWLGRNWTRLPTAVSAGQVAITIDDGPDPGVTPRVLDVLEDAGARATFFCIGERVTANPGLSREILARGHRIENHSQRHLHYFAFLGPRRMKSEIERAQEAIGIVTGERPRFFRAPAGVRNPFLDAVLTELDLRLVSWTRRGFDTVTRRSDVVFERLSRGLGPGDILLLHDGRVPNTAGGRPVILDVLPRLLETVARAGLEPVTLRDALQ
jgi:peptidoglycan/xylan/chitin deacetylase (PgdA/CDA1 family)